MSYIYNKVRNLLRGLSTPAVVAVAAGVMVSCSDKLDEVPDNRTEIDTQEKVALLLTSGYPTAVPAVIGELSGDNLVDNNVILPNANKHDADRMFHDEIYRWGDIRNYNTGDDDTPYQVGRLTIRE